MVISYNEFIKESEKRLNSINSLKDFNELYLVYFGTKGLFNKEAKKISTVSSDQKPILGIALNKLKKDLILIFQQKKTLLLKEKGDKKIDITYPGKIPSFGHLHPQTLVLNELIEIFKFLGFQVADGPEIESEWYNFRSLNFPSDHPAMDTQQSLKVAADKDNKTLLRTQTSAMQVRVMESSPPPLRVIVPGKCFRYEAVDASHGFEFWQAEGFAVDKNITLSDLFGTIEYVLKKLMGNKTKLRFACTNFPFVEPGVDTYMECTVCRGVGCSFCKNSGWSEIMPAGMIHPNVLKSAKIDSSKWQGFAFAIGLSRAVTLRYGISDLRVLTTPDLRILNQF